MTVSTASRPATERQINFIRDLIAERDGNATVAKARELLNELATNRTLTVPVASLAINMLKTIPRNSVPEPVIDQPKAENEPTKPVAITAPDGRYAVQLPIDDKLHFYRLRTGREGTRWAGKRFLDEQASDNWYPVEWGYRRMAVLEAIERDPAAAGTLYGQKIGRCYKCGRTLTDPTSRELGIGPDCRKEA